MQDVYAERKKIIQKLVNYAKKQLPLEQFTLLKPFLEQYYLYTLLDDLQQKTLQDLLGAVLSHWNLIYEKKAGEYKQRIYNPELDTDGWTTKHTVLQFILDDQPFLVDTITMEIDRMGFAVHFLVHLGGTKVIRNRHHEITQVLPRDATDEAASIEAPIYVEIDKQTNPEVLETLGRNLERVLRDARQAVVDWGKMQERIDVVLQEMDDCRPPVPDVEFQESKAFLRWMADNHFTFLGYRNYDLVGKGSKKAIQLVPDSSLGVLRDTTNTRTVRYLTELTPEAQQFELSKHIVLLAKTNTRATVHGRRYTDFVSVKRFNKKGDIIGEHWFIGLYTSPIYRDRPQNFPIVRLKVAEILRRSGFSRSGHSYKALVNILETLPRDDLFQASTDQLFALSMGILQLQERRAIRLFSRKDIFSRFISCLVYVPMDDFNLELCYRMQEILLQAFDGIEISYETLFSDSILARIHFTIRINPHKPHVYDLNKIEQKLVAAGRSWKDVLHESLVQHFGEEKGGYLAQIYKTAFPVSYKEAFSPALAVYDVEHIERLKSVHDLGMSLYRPENAPEQMIRFKLFHIQDTVPLSDAIPMLEKMGLRVIGEQPYELRFDDNKRVWINDFNLSYAKGDIEKFLENRNIFQEAFIKIWSGEAEHDRFNALVLAAQLTWREVTILRAYAKYLKQIGFTFSQDYMEEALSNNPQIAALLVSFFLLRFNPANKRTAELKKKQRAFVDQIKSALDKVANLDEDRILRMFLNLIRATVRTNYFQVGPDKAPLAHLAYKFNSAYIHNLPLPRPDREIFVYSPRFEGIHLRAGKVARGGIRWSDRREDFRREVLGLMKAQQVKNAVIIPAGAKGGFLPKNLSLEGSREAVLLEGIQCYQGFIRGLLDLTDNLDGNKAVHPQNTVCLDGDDPYFVVAADKGTATFSDMANAISAEYNFWLGDAFASGGSTGYDHKKMGITARGAWESVKNHFQELAIDIHSYPFTVIGIGDMAGDVFGNGMLQSKQIKLVAAFNGAHIFIDPDPNPAKSYAERKRLFELPRSTWEDYNPQLISAGGGVFKRSVKSIKLSPQMKILLGVKAEEMAPNELIRALLTAPVDLIWNGGIGTFVKASTETDVEVGDRASDAIRINGNQLTCKVVAEGGNLGFTQLARIEYELNGGRINTDFIDNSGGVDCSDHEVNIKILLDTVVAAGQLTEKSRNTLLAKMTDEIAELVLHNNYRQVRAITINVDQSVSSFDLYNRYLVECVRQGKIDAKIEFLPDQETMRARKAAGKGLTRPEVAVLLAYSKIILKNEILASDLLNDAYFARYIKYAFPRVLKDRYGGAMEQHRLRREIIATQLSNFLITDMGIAFIYQMYDELRASTNDVVRAYVMAREIFGFEEISETIESLDIPITVQKEITVEVVRLIRRAVRWLLRNQRAQLDIEATVDVFSKGVAKLKPSLPTLFLGAEKHNFETKAQAWIAAGVPTKFAMQMASCRALPAVLNIVQAAQECKKDLSTVAKVYFTVSDRLGVSEFRDVIETYPVDTRWMVLARAAVQGDLDWQQRAMTVAVLKMAVKSKEVSSQLEAWLEKNIVAVGRWQSIFADIKSSGTNDYAMLVVAVRELLDLVQANL